MIRFAFVIGLCAAGLAWLPTPVRAQDVAVLWDVSGSIRTLMSEPPYTEPLRRSVADLVVGRGIDPRVWTPTLPAPLPAVLEPVTKGGVPLVGTTGRVLIVRFGRFDRTRVAGLPYFPFNDIPAALPETLADTLMPHFPTSATEGRTNRDLAIAAASKYLADKGSRAWFVLTISDFNQDVSDDIGDAELQVIDEFLSGRTANDSAPIILRWRQTPTLQLRIQYFEAPASQAPPPQTSGPRSVSLLSPAAGATLPSGQRPTFGWRWNDPAAPPKGYMLIVTQSDGKTVIRQSTTGSSFSPATTLEPGSYSWQVFATVTPSVASDRRMFTVPGGGGGGLLLLVLLLLGGAAGAAWFLNNRRRRRS